jgi:EmrB/QacA subfamily drug resistance transporter
MVTEYTDGTKRATLLIAILSSFLTPFMGSSINVALPSIARELNIDAVLLSWVATSFLIASAVLLVPMGRIADIHGRKRVFTLGITIITAASLLAAFSPSVWVLLAFRVIQGIGGAMIFGTSIAILTSVFPLEERGRVLGITVAAVYLGLSLGPFFGGLLTEYLGWRSIFIANVPLGLVIICTTLAKLRQEWSEAAGERFDTLGSLLYGAGLVIFILGLLALPTPQGFLGVVAGLAGLALFVLWELRTSNPVVNMARFAGNRVFALSNLAALIHYSATFAVGFVLSLYLQYVRGMSARDAGLLLVAQPVVQAVFSPFAGALSDRVEPRFVASAGMACTAAGLFGVSFIGADTSLPLLVGVLMVLGFGFALFSSPNVNAIMSSVEKRFYGVASGMLATMRVIGQTLSMSLVALIFSVYLGRIHITPAYFPAFLKSASMIFVLFGSFCLVGMLASLARGRVRE